MQRILLSFVAFTLFMGCTDQATLAVSVQTDFIPEVEFATIRVSIETTDGTLSQSHAARAADYVRGQRVATFDNLPIGEFRVAAQVLALDGRILGQRRSVGPVTGITGVSIVISRSCASVTCPAGDLALTECSGGRCVRPECTPETPEQCSDGCKSEDDCLAPVDCAVGVCGADGSCFVASREGACNADEYCDVEAGCVARPITRDGGVDAGPTLNDSASPDVIFDAGVSDTQLEQDLGSALGCSCPVPEDECTTLGCAGAACDGLTACPPAYRCLGTRCICSDLDECGPTCASNADCAGILGFEQCDTTTQLCREPLPCLGDEDCPGTDICRAGEPSSCGPRGDRVIGQPCESRQECASGRCSVRDTAAQVCIAPCTRHSECDDGLRCVVDRHDGVAGCQVPMESCMLCSPDEACLFRGACLTLCVTSGSCLDGEVCYGSGRVEMPRSCGPARGCLPEEVYFDRGCGLPISCSPAYTDCPAGYGCEGDETEGAPVCLRIT